MTEASRRTFLGVAGALGLGSAAGEAAALPTGASEREASRILERYYGFGNKASGGPGDNATGEWLIAELTAMGYRCGRQVIETPAYEGPAPSLVSGAARAELLPQAIVQPTGPGGVIGPLRQPGWAPLSGAIALIVLPFARWSTAKGEVERRVNAVFREGAVAAVLVTTGPTGEALALNTPVDRPLFDRPVAVLAPRDAEPFVRASQAGATATLTMSGRAFRRPAFNVTAELSRGSGRSLVISTPRSGWFGCAGERGTGLAAWLMLARWASQSRLPADIALVATSGHEYEYAGGEQYIAHVAPKPDRTAFWCHLGANVAARDWRDRNPLTPLPSADPQRNLQVNPELLPAVRAAFAGQPGLEAPDPIDKTQAAGELASILHAGYPSALGIFGSHRFHHARADDLRCVAPALIPPVVGALTQVIPVALRRRP